MRISEFCNWLFSSVSDQQAFEEESHRLYRPVLENTKGWASAQKIHILNKALSFMEEGEQYLEIGSYCGRSLVGALDNNDSLAQVIDPFELFLPDGLVIYGHWQEAVSRFGCGDRITLHKALCNEFTGDLPPIGVFYYDGDHDSGHTYEGLKRFEDRLTDNAIIIVDDYSILGGYGQTPYPGHRMDPHRPVQTDTDRWVNENPFAELIAILPWEQESAVIRYERN